jgi:hypothetical protein
MQQTKAGIFTNRTSTKRSGKLVFSVFFRLFTWGFCVRFLKVEQQGNRVKRKRQSEKRKEGVAEGERAKRQGTNGRIDDDAQV